MEQVYNWVQANPVIIAVISSVICLALPNTVLVKAGFIVSQFVRRFLGKEVEKKLENIVDGFEQGLKSDDTKIDTKK